MPQLKLTDFWQSATMTAVLWSFVRANLGDASAVHLWENGAEGIAVLLGLGVGMGIGKRSYDKWVERKYGNADISTGGDPP